MAKPRLLKILMAPLFGLPAPVANLALGVAIYFRWQDFYQIMLSVCSPSLDGEAALNASCATPHDVCDERGETQ